MVSKNYKIDIIIRFSIYYRYLYNLYKLLLIKPYIDRLIRSYINFLNLKNIFQTHYHKCWFLVHRIKYLGIVEVYRIYSGKNNN